MCVSFDTDYIFNKSIHVKHEIGLEVGKAAIFIACAVMVCQCCDDEPLLTMA